MEERIAGLVLLLLLSGARVPAQVLTEHRWALLEMSTNGICRYGNRVDCCWGWTRESWGQCRPVCELGCKHGECVGPDECRCHQGYTGKTCNQDVNECGLKPRPCKHRCMNLVGSYKCFCLTGYMMTHDGTCRNTQTCAMANCQYGCAVMKGEVMCQCPSPGLRLGPDRRTCVDIDECVMGVAKCPRFRKCVNTFGSYICKCHKGFELRYVNGKYQCTGKNNPCHEKPDSKKCRCKPGTRGWSYDCKFVITVAVDPARPFTTPRPTTKITIATLITTTLDNRIQEITQRQRGDVHIPRNPEQNVFELDFDDIELGNTADFARDDSAAGSLSCSFDQGVCSWMTDQDGDQRWETVAEPHGGRYLTVPEPKTGQSFRGARLTIHLAPPTTPPWKGSDLCLVFRHRLQGLLIGSLQVFVKKGWGYSPAVWTRTSGHGWRYTQITLWGRGIKSVVFKGERRKGRSGEIAIDNVSIHRGVCSTTGGD
ncbi:hypothetical protein AMELA_G00198790 [Ameiurus melas]|uniref:Nephronectin n=1 Tax=Ameiurus melas TaxID=219545 RepID=A0A7J6A6E4_AMEME|nr:hypothetical protein AMELA_G00198790 [Ameiurus melas]